MWLVHQQTQHLRNTLRQRIVHAIWFKVYDATIHDSIEDIRYLQVHLTCTTTITTMDQGIEYCGSRWQSVLDRSAECESGHCCSIHEKCGLKEYHCWFGMPAEWIIFTGIMLMSVCWGFVFSLGGANRRIISLMEDYKRKGERIDALVVPITKRTWAGCYQQLQEGTRHC
jgi:hypothetical protein